MSVLVFVPDDGKNAHWLRRFFHFGSPRPPISFFHLLRQCLQAVSERVFPLKAPWELLPALLHYCRHFYRQMGTERIPQWKQWISFLTNLPTSLSLLLGRDSFFNRCLCPVKYQTNCDFFPSVKWHNNHKTMTLTGCALTSFEQSACSCHLTRGHAITLCNRDGK